MADPLPTIDPTDDSLGWAEPCKRIYGSEGVAAFQRSLSIDRIQQTVFLIARSISLTSVPKGVLDDTLVAFENAVYPGVAPEKVRQAQNTGRNAHTGGTGDAGTDSADLDLPGPEGPDFDFSTLSDPAKAVIAMLDEMRRLMDETPPFPGPRRYGNMACRDWHDLVTAQIDDVFDKHLGRWYNHNRQGGFITEAKYYFLGSFGSRERLDYGTGHELSFLAFISLLLMCGILQRESTTGTEYLVIFSRYYDFVRTLILNYTLEPAGSHGVWGLDDHFHLIYILGSCEMVEFDSLETGEKSPDAMNYRMGLTPSTVLNPSVLKRNRTRNLFYNAVAFIKKVKFGPFNEHSPLLYELATSKSWEKIAKGMIRMYYGEVLSKFPVVQHFYFGHVLFPWIDRETHKLLPEQSPEEEEINSDVPSSVHPKSVHPKTPAPSSTTTTTTAMPELTRSGAEIAMNSIYTTRGEELAKLHSERIATSQNGKRSANELPTSRSDWPSNVTSTTTATATATVTQPPTTTGRPDFSTRVPWARKDVPKKR